MSGKSSLSSKELSDIIRTGRKKSGKTLVLYTKRAPEDKGVAVGVTIAKKIVPLAVRRNYIRRVIRAYFKEHYRGAKTGEKVVVRVKNDADPPGKKAFSKRIRQELSSLIGRNTG